MKTEVNGVTSKLTVGSKMTIHNTTAGGQRVVEGVATLLEFRGEQYPDTTGQHLIESWFVEFPDEPGRRIMRNVVIEGANQ